MVRDVMESLTHYIHYDESRRGRDRNSIQFNILLKSHLLNIIFVQ